MKEGYGGMIFLIIFSAKGYGGVSGMGKNVWGLKVCFFNVIINLKSI